MGKWHGQTSPRKVSQCKAATWTRNADLILSLSQHFSTIAVISERRIDKLDCPKPSNNQKNGTSKNDIKV